MISGYNLKLKMPEIVYKSTKQIDDDEVLSLIKVIKDYFSQVNVIYRADLTISNNEWEDKCTEKGTKYKQRVDYTFCLMDLVKIELYDDCIKFIIHDSPDKVFKIPIRKDFFWFFEYESAFYD